MSAGEAQSFRALVDRHLPTVLAIARRMLRDDAEAEDVAQETLLRLWRNAASLELGEGGVRPWLRRVAANLCIDRVRARRNTSLGDEVPEESEPATQMTHLAERELSVRVDAALKALPDRQRLALTLFHYEGMSQIEVGEVDGYIGRGSRVAAGACPPDAQGSRSRTNGAGCCRKRTEDFNEGLRRLGADMTNTSNTGMTLADFERLLEVYGGDRTRWPAEARAAAAQLVARDAKSTPVLGRSRGARSRAGACAAAQPCRSRLRLPSGSLPPRNAHRAS